MKPGMRLKSLACTTEVMVIQAPAGDLAVTCGGAPLAPLGGPPQATTPLSPGSAGGTQIGKRYVNVAGDLELLCTKPGRGTLAQDGAPLAIKSPKPLPSSD
ncbi:MAG: hypothetical protein DCC71_24050 [Proteobacteria bacterium]|nr:MAG: hypothetical protein DCC71_24050 [Pseudomonadota bacterium]